MWLDFKIFGNGHGLKSPYFDDKFYWLVDTESEERKAKNGNFYNWIGGFGAQIVSREWRMIPAGTTRTLAGMKFRIFQCSRNGIRCEASWKIAQSNTPSIEEIAEIKRRIESVVK